MQWLSLNFRVQESSSTFKDILILHCNDTHQLRCLPLTQHKPVSEIVSETLVPREKCNYVPIFVLMCEQPCASSPSVESPCAGATSTGYYPGISKGFSKHTWLAGHPNADSAEEEQRTR